MSRGISARDMALDFIETVILIGLGFAIFYFTVIVDRFSFLTMIFKFTSAFSIMSLPFMIVLKINNRKIRAHRRENGSSDTTIAYVSRKDLIIDWLIIFLIVFLELLIPLFYGIYSSEDQIQAFFIFVLLSLWHLYFFRRRQGFGAEIMITKIDRLVDEIFIFFLPLVILLVLFRVGTFDVIDLIQSILVFVIMFVWRKFFYYKQK